jgi:hypothetical protein
MQLVPQGAPLISPRSFLNTTTIGEGLWSDFAWCLAGSFGGATSDRRNRRNSLALYKLDSLSERSRTFAAPAAVRKRYLPR